MTSEKDAVPVSLLKAVYGCTNEDIDTGIGVLKFNGDATGYVCRGNFADWLAVMRNQDLIKEGDLRIDETMSVGYRGNAGDKYDVQVLLSIDVIRAARSDRIPIRMGDFVAMCIDRYAESPEADVKGAYKALGLSPAKKIACFALNEEMIRKLASLCDGSKSRPAVISLAVMRYAGALNAEKAGVSMPVVVPSMSIGKRSFVTLWLGESVVAEIKSHMTDGFDEYVCECIQKYNPVNDVKGEFTKMDTGKRVRVNISMSEDELYRYAELTGGRRIGAMIVSLAVMQMSGRGAES